MHPQKSRPEINQTIVYTVGVMIALPILFAVLGNWQSAAPVNEPQATFDTLRIKGYNFFKGKGVPVTPDSDTLLLSVVYDHIGIPHVSRAGNTGLDCSGLVRRVYKKAYGIRLRGSSHDMYNTGRKVSDTELKVSDLVFFRIGSGRINHVGIYLGEGKFVHTSTSMGVAINDLSEPYYRRYYSGAARIILDGL